MAKDISERAFPPGGLITGGKTPVPAFWPGTQFWDGILFWHSVLFWHGVLLWHGIICWTGFLFWHMHPSWHGFIPCPWFGVTGWIGFVGRIGLPPQPHPALIHGDICGRLVQAFCWWLLQSISKLFSFRKILIVSYESDFSLVKTLRPFSLIRSLPYKKEARSRASPPAASRLISPILFHPIAFLAERFYVIGRTFLWHKTGCHPCLTVHIPYTITTKQGDF